MSNAIKIETALINNDWNNTTLSGLTSGGFQILYMSVNFLLIADQKPDDYWEVLLMRIKKKK